MVLVCKELQCLFQIDGGGGRVRWCASGKNITECATILRILLPRDVILADRELSIEESVAFYRAKDKVTAFSKDINQLAGIDLESARRTGAFRMHALRSKCKML